MPLKEKPKLKDINRQRSQHFLQFGIRNYCTAVWSHELCRLEPLYIKLHLATGTLSYCIRDGIEVIWDSVKRVCCEIETHWASTCAAV